MNDRLRHTFEDLIVIDSPTFGERDFCDALKAKLDSLGISYVEDNAGEQIGGNCGNLYACADGGAPLEPLLFSAHMDTVEPSKGKTAVVHPNGKITSDGTSVLGADDVSGIAVILESITRLKERGTPFRPVELLFTVAEERYCLGSSVFEYDKIKSKNAYTLDLTGKIGNAANAAPTILSFEIKVKGKAAHAGFAPNDGVHAIAVCAKAVTEIKMGEAAKDLTCNIGTIIGGTSRNIVPDICTVSGEIRSLKHDQAILWWRHIKAVFESIASKFGATVDFSHKTDITAYHTPENSLAVKRFRRACERVGVKPDIKQTFGGSDQNNFSANGIEGIVIACSMYEVHSAREYTLLDEMEKCVKLIMNIILDR
jgi:tripeptide aminopeptidase